MMERLTEREAFGGGIPIGYFEDDCCDCQEYCQKQASCSKCNISACFEKLADYEDAEEDGKLLRLPFSMGEEVYTIFNHRVVKGTFAGVYFKGIDIWFAYDQVDYDVLYKGKIIHAQGIFETYEEAKAKLKLKEANNDT